MLRTTRWLTLCAILMGASGLRLWHIDSLPPGFSYAEAYEGLEAWHILTDITYRPLFLPRNNGVPVLNVYANALMFGLFRRFGGEAGPVAMRVTAACFGVLGVLALYGWASELQKLDRPKVSLSRAFPCFAAATLAVIRWHIHFSRIGIEAILVPLVWASAVWLLLRGWRTGHWVNFAGSGVMVAASVYAYQAAWVIPFLMVPVALLLLTRRATMKEEGTNVTNLRVRQKVGLLIAALVVFVVVAPFGWYTWKNPDLVILRLTQVGIGGSLQAATNPSIWHNVWTVANMYNPLVAHGDHDPARNIPDLPALNLWLALPFYAGLGIAVWRVRRLSYVLVLISLIGLLLPGTLSQHAPNFRRLLGAAAPTALLCGLALDTLWQWRPTRVAQIGWVSLLILLLGGATSTREYFVRWAALPALDQKFAVEIWQLGQQIVAQPSTTPLYVTPHDIDHPALKFSLVTHHHAEPITFNGNHIFPLTAHISPRPELYMVSEPQDSRTRLLLPQIFPNAQIQQATHKLPGADALWLYLRPANTVPQRPPQHPLTTILGDGIALLSYDVQPARLRASHILYLQLHWLVQATPTGDWTVFTHLLTKDALGHKRFVTGYDSRPGNGSLPNSQWQKGWRILDEYQIKLPVTLQPGQYALAIGLYQMNGKHLPLVGDGVILGTVNIE